MLVAARPPLGAFNVRLGPQATRDDARAVAAAIREGAPGGLPGVRALGLWAGGAQVSTNVEDLERVRLAEVLAAIAARAPVAGAELVAPVPRAALEAGPRTSRSTRRRRSRRCSPTFDRRSHWIGTVG